MDAPPSTRRSPALIPRERDVGLRRIAIGTALGRVVVRAGRRADGPATILLHGAAGSWTTWTPLLAAADAASAPLTDVVAPDLPGWGDSGTLPRRTDVGAMSDAVVEIARSLGYTSWRVVGHSLGGFVALDLAARHPRETIAVILVSPSGAGVVDALRRPLRGGARVPGFAGMLLTMRMLAGLGAAGRVFVRALDRIGALRTLTAPLFARPRSVHRSVIAAFVAELRPRAFVRAAAAARAYDLETWRRITCPVVAVRGSSDVFAAAADTAGFASRVGGYREVQRDDAGHFAHIERPDVVLAAISSLAPSSAPEPGVHGDPQPDCSPAIRSSHTRVARARSAG